MFKSNNFYIKKSEEENLNQFILKKKTNTKKLKKILTKKYLNDNNYFFLYDLKAQSHKEFEKKIIRLSSLFGLLAKQNSKEEKILKIQVQKDNNKKYSLKNKLRYHQTNTGGSIHTDGPQLYSSPKILLMGCFKQSNNGGESLIVNGKNIFKKLDDNEKKILTKNFFFERRGFEKKILSKPIFQYNKKIFIFRYLREYLLKAYELKKVLLKNDDRKVLKKLDILLNKKSNQKEFKLKENQVVVINNHVCAHGRKKFKMQKNYPRLLYRLWVK